MRPPEWSWLLQSIASNSDYIQQFYLPDISSKEENDAHQTLISKDLCDISCKSYVLPTITFLHRFINCRQLLGRDGLSQMVFFLVIFKHDFLLGQMHAK